MVAVIISKAPSVLVKPSEPAVKEASGFIKLTSYDRTLLGRSSTVFLVFDQQIDVDPAETIRRGLSKALLYYYPMSGRLAAGATAGEVVVECNGEGVSFVVASATCALNDVHGLHEPSVQEELAVLYPPRAGGGLHTDPLLLIQVTVFSCGGFVVGLTWEHAIADGKGIGQFLEALGEFSRGLPSPSVIPVRSDDSLIGAPQTGIRFLMLLQSLVPSPLVLLDLRVPSSIIHRIKQDFSSVGGGGANKTTCSVFEVVSAVLWKCRARAVMEDPDAPTMLSFAVNSRKYAGAKHGYYGNCLTGAVVMTTFGDVANGDIMDLIKMIQHAKDLVSGQYANDEHASLRDLAKAKSLDGYSIFCLTTWRNLGAEKADFGGGTPARVMRYTKYWRGIPFCSSCLPGKNNHFFSAISLCVKEEHAGAFLQELANFT